MVRKAECSLRLATLALLWISADGMAQTACEAGAGKTRVDGRNVALVYQPRPAKIKVGEMFALDLTLCPKHGKVRAVAVDAAMPDHKHGMNYKPAVKSTGTDRFSASGLMFHMPGRWQLAFEVDTDAGRERVLHNLTID